MRRLSLGQAPKGKVGRIVQQIMCWSPSIHGPRAGTRMANRPWRSFGNQVLGNYGATWKKTPRLIFGLYCSGLLLKSMGEASRGQVSQRMRFVGRWRARLELEGLPCNNQVVEGGAGIGQDDTCCASFNWLIAGICQRFQGTSVNCLHMVGKKQKKKEMIG
jgi:hypothetical protein